MLHPSLQGGEERSNQWSSVVGLSLETGKKIVIAAGVNFAMDGKLFNRDCKLDIWTGQSNKQNPKPNLQHVSEGLKPDKGWQRALIVKV